MTDEELAIGCKEALVILSKLPPEDRKKIDPIAIETLKQSADLNYDFELVPGISLNDQKISPAGRSLISIIYRNTFCSYEEKMAINKRDQLEIERRNNLNENKD